MNPHLATPGFSELAAPFVANGVLSLGEVHTVDRLARLAHQTDCEALLGLAFAVRAPRVGHTGVNIATIHLDIATEAGSAAPLIWPSPAESWRERCLASPLVGNLEGELRPFTRLGHLLQTTRLSRYESRLADMLVNRAGLLAGAVSDATTLKRDLANLFGPVPAQDRQQLAAVLALLNRTTVISGGPGTGKTTTVRKVLCLLRGQALAKGARPPRVALAAPTGKAAARMREALLSKGGDEPTEAMAWIETMQAVTLHRLLGFSPATPSRFRHHANNPLPYDVIVVDEASMIDVAMMCKLVDAVDTNAQLVLLGDRNQLASVEAGCVLADLTALTGPSGIRLPPSCAEAVADLLGPMSVADCADPTAPVLASGMVHFHTAYRFGVEALRVPIYALADASGNPEHAAEHLAKAVNALVKSGTAAVACVAHAGESLHPDVLTTVVDAYRAAIRPLRAQPENPDNMLRALSALGELRVLAAHRKGALGVTGLNEAISRRLRTESAGGESESGPWWVGRLVLVTQNDYEHQLWNGDVGVATRSTAGWVVAFSAPEGVRQVPVGSLPTHETAFAMTIHKSQGSQFRHAVVVLPATITPLLTRELIYTGISRASHQLTLCGSAEVLEAAVQRRVLRASGLGLRLGEGRATREYASLPLAILPATD